jgi:hypothetical protein
MELPTKRFESDDAREYADLVSVCNDLTFVLAATDRLLQELDKRDDKPDQVVLRAYWSAATIAYMRCFGSGKRRTLKANLFATVTGGAETHEHIKNTRDKHVAHSVNAFEEAQVGFIVGAAPTTSVEGVAHMMMFRICDDKPGVQNLQLLARTALTFVRPRLQTLANLLLEVGQKMPRSKVDELPYLRLQLQPQPQRPRR